MILEALLQTVIPDDQHQSFVDELFPTFCIVLLKKGDELDISGNAVMISSDIAITATHVLLQNTVGSFGDIDISNRKVKDFYAEESLNILINSAKYKKGFMLNVHRVIVVQGTDISILYLKDTTNSVPPNAWNDIKLNIIPPDIDSHVFTIGSVLKPGSHTIKQNDIYIDPEFVASFGVVGAFMERHPIYAGPGFYATLTAFNTQSGSPVYNKDKELVGIISGGPDDHTTYVSALYPLFTSTFIIEDYEAFHLYDAARKGTVKCQNIDKIKIAGRKVSITLPKELKL